MIARFPAATKAAVLLALSFPQLTAAAEGGGFTGADVLAWPEADQEGYFQASVTMIGIVATQVEGKEHIADCIDGWYGGGEQALPKRAARIRQAMQALPQYHPQATILAVIVQECGEF